MENKQEKLNALQLLLNQALAAPLPFAHHEQAKKAAQFLAEALGLVEKPKEE